MTSARSPLFNKGVPLSVSSPLNNLETLWAAVLATLVALQKVTDECIDATVPYSTGSRHCYDCRSYLRRHMIFELSSKRECGPEALQADNTMIVVGPLVRPFGAVKAVAELANATPFPVAVNPNAKVQPLTRFHCCWARLSICCHTNLYNLESYDICRPTY